MRYRIARHCLLDACKQVDVHDPEATAELVEQVLLALQPFGGIRVAERWEATVTSEGIVGRTRVMELPEPKGSGGGERYFTITVNDEEIPG